MKLMKVFLLSVAMTALAWNGAQAQCSSNGGCAKTCAKKWQFAANAGVGLPQHDVTPVFAGVNLGYEFAPRVYAFARAEMNTGLYEKDGDRTFNSAGNLGAGLGYRLLGGGKCSACRSLKECLDVRVMAGSSIGHADWKQTFYDAGLEYYYRGSRFFCTPTIGLGYRYVDSRTTGLRNYGSAYVSIGFRF